jgi:(p)ppGpp synthase/HD superfamily hydrolase
MSDLLFSAKEFTINAHNSVNQKRKYTGEPYHVHPERVANLVAAVTSDTEIIAAAWLHDVLEDVAPKNPEFNEDAILKTFGPRVLKLVIELTDISKPEDGNRAARKALDRLHLSKACPDAMTVKLADMIDNIFYFSEHDPHFARVFRREAKLTLPFLKSGNKSLYDRLSKLLNN